MSDSPPLIALLTDFGLKDAYVGILKAVILSRCPAARIVDITHDVGVGNIRSAAYLLGTAWSYFPPGTVFALVVDPGVGSDRRILAADVEGSVFLCPDNGLLSEVFLQHKPRHVVSVENDRLFLHPLSRTFHGRDIIAPSAAALAGGLPMDQLGPRVDRWIQLPSLLPIVDAQGHLVGRIVHIDHFGNLVTNLPAGEVAPTASVHVAGHVVRGVRGRYAAADRGELLAVVGSTGRVEISVNHGDAGRLLGASVGDPVWVEAAGA